VPQPTPQQQQQQQAAREAVRAAIIQQQGSNLGPPQGYSSPGYQGQAMNGQRTGPQGKPPPIYHFLVTLVALQYVSLSTKKCGCCILLKPEDAYISH
jgi:hypothetical protein